MPKKKVVKASSVKLRLNPNAPFPRALERIKGGAIQSISWLDAYEKAQKKAKGFFVEEDR
jgi:hypothetical protein